MKRFLIYLLLVIHGSAWGQRGLFINGSDASLRVDSTSFISVDGDFQNLKCDPTKYVRFNGPLYLSGSLINNDLLKFTAAPGPGNAKKARIIFTNSLTNPFGAFAVIGGNVEPKFWEVELDKGSGVLTLSTNINCSDTLNFKTGLVLMNGFKWNLIDPVGAPSVINHPFIKNERNGSQFFANSITDTGLVIYKSIYNTSVNALAANMGISISGPVNISSPFSVYRGFLPQVNAGKGSIQRYFDIYSPGHSLVNNTITVNYLANDTSYFPASYFHLQQLRLFVSLNQDQNWSPLFSTIQNTLVTPIGPVNNGGMSANLSDLNHPHINILGKAFRITVADPDCPNPPVSALTLDTLHICAGTTATLDAGNNSSIQNTTLRWQWNTSPVLYTQTHTVNPTNGYQKFVVTLMDASGCETKDSIVIAPQAPYPQITYLNHLNSCIGDSITIKDTVKIISGTTTNSWLFSDGSASSTPQKLFRKKFNASGLYSFQLTATSNFGCSATSSSTNVIVYPLPTPAFTQSLNCSSGLVSFSNISVSNHTSMAISGSFWWLGQGPLNTSTLNSPSQTYSASGSYTVKLLATTSFGCKDSVVKAIVIFPANQTHFTKNNSCLNDTVYFANTSACNTGSCSYTWSFGDATQSTLAVPKKVYTSSGLYTVKLKVTNPQGCPDSTSSYVYIHPKPATSFVTTNTSVCINNFIYLTNTSTLSSGNILSYSWNFGNSSFSGTNAVVNYTSAGIYTITLSAQSDSGCVNSFTLPVIARPQPTAQYQVSNACFGSASNFVSTSSGQNLYYIWNYGNTVVTTTTSAHSQNYTYPSTGTYTTQLIAFNTWGCSDTSALVTSIVPAPQISLGGNITTCGSSYTLNANNSGATFFWLPGNLTTQTLQVLTSGFYNVTVTNTDNCVSTETVMVTLNALVNPDLGNDTTVCGALVLNAGYAGSSYAWNTGATTQTVLASSSGIYSVQVTDQNGCVGTDSIAIVLNAPPTVNLGNNVQICKPKYGFSLSANSNASSFLWSTGLTTSIITISSGGSYWLEASATNGCKARDTIQINFLNTPQIELGPDKSACGTTLLDAQNFGCSYSWSNGSANQIINLTSSGLYWITVTNTTNACSQNDSITVTIHTLMTVSLGNDTTLCNNLSFSLDAGNTGSSYSWLSSQTTQTIAVTSSGVYGVSVTSTNGCSSSDYISVTLIGAPIVELGNDIRYLCGTNTVDLQLTNTGVITWGSSLGLSATSPSLIITKPGMYWANVSASGCSASDSVLIISTSNTIQASFLASTLDTINKPVKFVNLSNPTPIHQLWTFGDGLTSTDLSPVHTYVLPQDFSVTLEVSNGFCSDKITKQLSVLFKQSPIQIQRPVRKLELLSLMAFPNPSNSYLNISFELNDYANIEMKVYDLTGKLLLENSAENSITNFSVINTCEFKNGLYFLHFQSHSLKGDINKTLKFIKTN
ncbi:hypothetical protein CNR22_11205 [Sphingobacteriaceae bacterium]|nr:hypothetical protein CNR22_11205 [Sphingobacteriaceae bacterium]